MRVVGGRDSPGGRGGSSAHKHLVPASGSRLGLPRLYWLEEVRVAGRIGFGFKRWGSLIVVLGKCLSSS